MKKLIVGMACCSLLSLAVFTPVVSFAQGSATSNTKMKPQDGTVRMKGGKMVIMKGGAWTPMTKATTMSDGSKVMTNGTVVGKDGKKTTLKEGDHVMPDGTIKAKKG